MQFYAIYAVLCNLCGFMQFLCKIYAERHRAGPLAAPGRRIKAVANPATSLSVADRRRPEQRPSHPLKAAADFHRIPLDLHLRAGRARVAPPPRPCSVRPAARSPPSSL